MSDKWKYMFCVRCKKAFTEENVRSSEGWVETQISGLCEKCFDLITMEIEDNDERSDND